MLLNPWKEHTYYNTIEDKIPPRSGVVDMNAHKKGYVNDEFIKEHLKEKEKSPSQVLIMFFAFDNVRKVYFLATQFNRKNCKTCFFSRSIQIQILFNHPLRILPPMSTSMM